MKVRFDFVTNSSSSSFVIASKEELNKKMLYELFQISDNHPLRELLQDIANTILHSATKSTLDEIREDDYSLSEQCAKYLDKGFHLYHGSFSDEGYGSDMAESYLCSAGLNIETDDFIMIHEGGY